MPNNASGDQGNANKAGRIINAYHGRLAERITAWQEHFAVLKSVSEKLVNPREPYSFRELVADVLGLGIACYDNTIGWMYPQSGSAPEERQRDASENRGGSPPESRVQRNNKHRTKRRSVRHASRRAASSGSGR